LYLNNERQLLEPIITSSNDSMMVCFLSFLNKTLILTRWTHTSCTPHLSASPTSLVFSVLGRGRSQGCRVWRPIRSVISHKARQRRRQGGEQIRDGDERVEEERGGAGRLAPRDAVPVARAGRRSPDARPGAHPPRPPHARPPIVCTSPFPSLSLPVFSGLTSIRPI
jgi:hypothetical protein